MLIPHVFHFCFDLNIQEAQSYTKNLKFLFHISHFLNVSIKIPPIYLKSYLNQEERIQPKNVFRIIYITHKYIAKLFFFLIRPWYKNFSVLNIFINRAKIFFKDIKKCLFAVKKGYLYFICIKRLFRAKISII